MRALLFCMSNKARFFWELETLNCDLKASSLPPFPTPTHTNIPFHCHFFPEKWLILPCLMFINLTGGGSNYSAVVRMV